MKEKMFLLSIIGIPICILNPIDSFGQYSSFTKTTVTSSILSGRGIASDSWHNGTPNYLELNSGCVNPTDDCNKLFVQSVFSFTPSDSNGEWTYNLEFTDTLSINVFLTADIDGDSIDEVIVSSSFYQSIDSTYLYVFDRIGDTWKKTDIVSQGLFDIAFASDILGDSKEEIIFTYANDPESDSNVDEWNPLVGFAIMSYENGQPQFYFDNTKHDRVKGIGWDKDNPTDFFIIEGFEEDDPCRPQNVKAHIVKYSFSEVTKQFTEKYKTTAFEPYLDGFQQGSLSISVNDSIISVLDNNSLSRYNDTGTSLKKISIQQVDTLLFGSFWFDYNQDGTDEIFGAQNSETPENPLARFSIVYYEEKKNKLFNNY